MKKFHPYPFARAISASPRLDLTARISAPSGWIDLNYSPYRLEASTFGERSVSWRKREVSSEFVEGTFVVSAVRENVTETLAVWVKGESEFDLQTNLDKLCGALEQLSYRLMQRHGNSAVYYDCTVADYTVTESREFKHAGIALVRASVPRHPQAEHVYAAVDER